MGGLEEGTQQGLIEGDVADGGDHGVVQVVHGVGQVVRQARILRGAPVRLRRDSIRGRSRAAIPRSAMSRPRVADAWPRCDGPAGDPSPRSAPGPTAGADRADTAPPPRSARCASECGRSVPGAARRDVQTGDHAQASPPLPAALLGPLAARRPGAAVQRLQQEAGFVEEHDASFSPGSPFLIRGQSSRRQCSIAASSRSRALRRGFCGVKPKACNSRPTWSTWYVTPNSRWITCRTRTGPQVAEISGGQRATHQDLDELAFLLVGQPAGLPIRRPGRQRGLAPRAKPVSNA